MSAPRVLFVRNCRGITDVTGAESYLLTLIQGLRRAGCDAQLLCAIDEKKGDTPWLQTLRSRDIPHELVNVPSKFSRADLHALLAKIVAMKPQVLHAMDHRTDAIAVLASRRMQVPAVASFFGWTNWSATSLRGIIYPIFDRFVMQRLSKIIVDSEQIAERIKTKKKDHVAVIPNGVDLTRFDPDTVVSQLKSTWFGREDVTLVGAIGRIHPNKGHVDLAKVAGRILAKRPDVRFVILGDPPPGAEAYQAELNATIKAQGMDKEFLVTNVPSADIPAAISAFDITAMPSYMESLAYVMLESMAMKKPIVSANVGGHGTLIDDGRNGFLHRSGDLDTLEAKLMALIDDPALRARIGQAGRDSMRETYSVDAMVEKSLRIYSEVSAC